MNNTNIHFHIAPDCLITGKGIIEPAMKLGISGFDILRYTDKHSNSPGIDFKTQIKASLDKLMGVLNNNSYKKNPLKTITFGMSCDWFSNITQDQIINSKCAFKKFKPIDYNDTCKYSNRFFPADIQKYKDYTNIFIDELSKRKFVDNTTLFDKATFDLWEEPNADRYNFMESFQQFIDFTNIKYDIFKTTNRPITIAHTTTSLINADNHAFKPEYLNWINSTDLFNKPNVAFSTSMYKNNLGGIYDYDNNKFPTQLSCKKILTECGYVAGLSKNTDKWKYFISDQMMYWFIDILKYSKKINADIISLFTLYDCSSLTDKGILAYWEPTNNGSNVYVARPHWKVFVDWFSVVKNGWIETATGVKGVDKEIILRDNKYTIVNNV